MINHANVSYASDGKLVRGKLFFEGQQNFRLNKKVWIIYWFDDVISHFYKLSNLAIIIGILGPQ